MPTNFVDFREVKARVSIRDALARYHFLDGLKDKGNGNLVGPCPIHGGKNPNAFHVSTEKNAFNCFTSCGGGNVLDLVAKVERVSVRDAALNLADWFGITTTREATSRASRKATKEERVEATTRPARDQATRGHNGREESVINPPLDHELKTLDPKHPYLLERGLTPETVKAFGLGFCSRGLMKNRIAIPIHVRGELVAYAGRAVDPELAKEKGKYLLPAGFQKSHVVYNLDRARKSGGEGLVLCEGMFDVMRVHAAGYPNVVALMGSSLSEFQEQLLVDSTDRLMLMLDGDEAGHKCLREFYRRMRRRLFLREVHLEDGEQPDNLSPERIRELLEVGQASQG